MLHVAFASTDDVHVNTHFGAAERFVIFDVSPGYAEKVAIGEFPSAVMKGENRNRKLPVGTVYVPGEEMQAQPGELDKPPEDKVVDKLELMKDCAAVFAASIGTSSIKRLMAIGVQPVIVDNNHDVVELLTEVSLALATEGLLSWVDKAKAKALAGRPELTLVSKKDAGRQGTHRLATTLEELE